MLPHPTSAAILESVEESIKSVIVERGLSEYTNTSDFDVLLSDYFDMIAGDVTEGKGVCDNNNNNNRRLVTLAEHTSDHGRQTNSSTEEKGEQV